MAAFKKTVATAQAKVAKAEFDAFKARMEAIDVILQDASPHEVLTLCARAFAQVVPGCCEEHRDEFKAEFQRVLNDCLAAMQEEEQDAAEDEDDARPQVH